MATLKKVVTPVARVEIPKSTKVDVLMFKNDYTDEKVPMQMML